VYESLPLSGYLSFETKFYEAYSEDLEKQIQEATRKFDLALRNYNEFVRENYEEANDICC
jgi:hypothetical protein